MRNTDEDIKIFHPKKEQGAGAELAQLALLTDEYRRNGNIQKAVDLGEKLALLLPETLFPSQAPKLSNRELMQLRSLIVFSVQISLHRYLPHTMLASQAINTMYSEISAQSPGFFANISDGSSFSFYYLSVRKETDDAASEIGKNYAMLCERDGDPEAEELGRTAFVQTDSYVFNLVEQAGFAI